MAVDFRVQALPRRPRRDQPIRGIIALCQHAGSARAALCGRPARNSLPDVRNGAYLRQMIAEFHKLAGTLPSQTFNPVAGFKIEPRPKKDKSSNQGGKRALPVGWVRDLASGKLTDGIKVDGRVDIGIVVAETGCRQTEIVHLPPEDIILNHPIPHLRIRYVEEGEHVRDIKNLASIRLVPLLGAALEAMRRHPDGFSRYRAKGSFSGDINKFLRDNNLFPAGPEGGKPYTFGGTRHTWEERARAAGMTNEERAFLLGHSVGKLRGRPVYGDGPELKLRALYAELVAFPTAMWRPRPQTELRNLIEAELEAQPHVGPEASHGAARHYSGRVTANAVVGIENASENFLPSSNRNTRP